MVNLAVVIEDDDDDDDETFVPHRTQSSKLRETHGGSKQWGSPPAKKAYTESPMPQKALKSKSHKVSHTLQDEWEEHEESRKGLEYKDMHYHMFELVMKLEQLIFEKCNFDQPPISHPSPLQGLDKPSPGSKSTYSKMTTGFNRAREILTIFGRRIQP